MPILLASGEAEEAEVVTGTGWWLRGDYFENCNCDIVCPCLFSSKAPMTSAPTEGACEVSLAFQVDEGRFGKNAHFAAISWSNA